MGTCENVFVLIFLVAWKWEDEFDKMNEIVKKAEKQWINIKLLFEDYQEKFKDDDDD